MEKYSINRNGSTITIWDRVANIGLRFTEGETMQSYVSSIVIGNKSILSDESGIRQVNKVSDELRKFAQEKYPKEFAPIKQ